ncbi:hypothetical protein [Lactococcus cremoris]|uniref:Uncharacterized protein n=1 Tax=Lactococcus lactis subsp. cremoris TaxID=1359 RepID=A0AAD1NH93_LACLC|nr:hypothetical protein [Lactococcus cremoris]MCT4431278.1 hypothetical protein [Lactococcus cremoris]BBC76277.1 hypothetical protein LLCC_1902 [Lactococcus cremoris]BCO02393.1 hypothetical protein LLG32_04870 [Lactococcus cremoris]BCO04944.1 hypothetical protein LLC_01840 [Lactococcus cremoris]
MIDIKTKNLIFLGLLAYWLFPVALALFVAISQMDYTPGFNFGDYFIGSFLMGLIFLPLPILSYIILLWLCTAICIMTVSNLGTTKAKIWGRVLLVIGILTAVISLSGAIIFSLALSLDGIAFLILLLPIFCFSLAYRRITKIDSSKVKRK